MADTSFLLPKFGKVSTSYLGFVFGDEEGTFIVETGASAGPIYRGVAGTKVWQYELDANSEPYSGAVGTQKNTVDYEP